MNCPNCLKFYNNKFNYPRILNKCGHTYCEECINTIATSTSSYKNLNESDSNINKDLINIICPNCNLETQVEKINQLTKNLALLDNIGTVYQTVINTYNTNNVEFNDFKSNSQLGSIFRSGCLSPLNKNVCSVHSKDLEAYCETDKVMLCVSCILENDHKNHDLSSIEKAAQKERTFLEFELNKTLIIESNLRDSIKEIEIKKDDIKSKCETQIENVKDFYKSIKDYIIERENEIMDDILKITSKELELINSIIENLECEIYSIEEIQKFKKNLDQLSEFEILIKSKEINKKIKNLNLEIPDFKSRDVYYNEFDKEGEIKLMKKKLNLKLSHNKDELIKVNLQLETLQNKIERIENLKNNQSEELNSSRINNALNGKADELESLSKSKVKGCISINKYIQKPSLVTNNHSKYLKKRDDPLLKSKNQSFSVKINSKTPVNNLEKDFNFVKKPEDNDPLSNTTKGAKKLALFPTLKTRSLESKSKENETIEIKSDKNLEGDNNEKAVISKVCDEDSNKNDNKIDSLNISNEFIIDENNEIYEENFSKFDDVPKSKIDEFGTQHITSNHETFVKNMTQPRFRLLSEIKKEEEDTVNIDMRGIKDDLDSSRSSFHMTKSFQMDLASLYKGTCCFLLVLGGKGDFITRRYCLDTFEWSQINSEKERERMNVERSDFSAIMYKDKKILLLGGKITNHNGTENISDSIDLLNATDRSIRKLDIKMKHPRINFGVVYVNSKLYVAGGFNGREVLNNVEFFDQRNKMWIDLPKMLFKRREFCMVFGLDNFLYSIGGSDEKEIVTKSVEKFDLVKCNWVRIDDMIQKRKACSAVCMPDGIYVFGGYDGCQYLKSVEKYDFQSRKWKYLQDMSNSRCHFACCVSNDLQYIYVIGGYNGKPLNQVERFCIISGAWEPVDQMPYAKYRHCALFINE